MNARWKCPTCNAGVIAPTKPRMNDVRRYCLPCSAKAGVLVERIAPALEKKREAKKETTKKKSAAKRATISKNNAPAKQQARIDALRIKMIHKEAERIWRLMKPYHNGRPLPTINIVRAQNRGRQYGHAYRNSIQVNVDRDQSIKRSKRVWEVLAHELAHCAVPPKHTDNSKRNVHSKEFYQCLRTAWQQRWKCSISFHEVSTWGYSVDYIIQRQAEHLIDWVLPTITNPETIAK
jgi:predicted SprT family Zn-dependent metalloprotease